VEPVSFFLPGREALEGSDPLELEPDRDWEIFGTGVYIWILQTFLRLRDAGDPVRLTAEPPAQGVVVCFADDFDDLRPYARNLTTLSVRADRRPQVRADFEVVQNTASAGPGRFYIPHWTQPGLIGRDPARGTRVETVGYMGATQQLHEELQAPSWQEELGRRGLAWANRMVTFQRNDVRQRDLRWNDYAEVDIVVGLRPPALWESQAKPAAKLQNAWSAGVPAVLSPELPYRELRRSSLDYLEARDATEALQAIDRLRDDGELYAAMVANGLRRAKEFDVEHVRARWEHVLWQELPAATRGGRHRVKRLVRRIRHATTR
jgi:hypothetical protein